MQRPNRVLVSLLLFLSGSSASCLGPRVILGRRANPSVASTTDGRDLRTVPHCPAPGAAMCTDHGGVAPAGLCLDMSETFSTLSSGSC